MTVELKSHLQLLSIAFQYQQKFIETASNNNNNNSNNNIQTSTPQGQTLVLQSFWELTCTNIPEIDCFDLRYKVWKAF